MDDDDDSAENHNKMEDEVYLEEQTPQKRLALMQSMVDACYYTPSDCPVCRDLQRRIEAVSHSSQTVVKPVSSSVLIELEQSRVVKQQLELCAQAYYFSQRPGSVVSTESAAGWYGADGRRPAAIAAAAVAAAGAAAGGGASAVTGAGGGASAVTGAGSGGAGAGAGGNTDRASQLDDFRESSRSYAEHADGDRNISLSYGLHHLIRDIDLMRNHRIVFQRLSQLQQRSLLAQISCKETLWKETENDAKLLRIEQELNDLLAKEDTVRQVTERQSSVGGMTSTSKKSSHDQGFLL